jgi:hypothetical protein
MYCKTEKRKFNTDDQQFYDTTLCYKVCQWLATGRWFSLGTPVSSTDKTDRHDIAKPISSTILPISTE